MKNSDIVLSDVLDALSNFDEFFRPLTKADKQEPLMPCATTTIPTNIKKAENGYEVEMKVPGYEKDNVSAEMIDTKHLKVVVQAEQEEKDPDHHKEFHRSEYQERIVAVDKDVDSSGITASLNNGILSLFLPFAKTVDGRKILIK